MSVAVQEQESTNMARLASAFLVADSEDYLGALNGVIACLKQDARVLSVERTPPDDEKSPWTEGIYPYSPRSSNLLRGTDIITVFRVTIPVEFIVRVPIKNQPAHHGLDDVTTDTYHATWDGSNLIVAWAESGADISISAGQVVLAILKDACVSAGSRLHVQSCNPSCTYGFVHSSLRLVPDEDVDMDVLEFDVQIEERDRNQFDVLVPDGVPLSEILVFLHFAVSSGILAFAESKSLGQRVLDLEAGLRSEIVHLLAHAEENARHRSDGVFKNIPERWQNRAWRKEVRHLIARCWLLLSAIELVQRNWSESVHKLESDWSTLMPLFRSENSSDLRSIELLDLGNAISMIEQISATMDNRAVAQATAWGALGGAVAGAAAGAVSQGLL